MFDKLTEEEMHEWRLWELCDALEYGTRKEVIQCLKKLDRLDGEPLQILVQQLEGSTSAQHKFRNQFRLVSPPGRPPSIAAMPLIRDGIRRFYRRCRDEGLSSKEAVFKTQQNYDVRRALLMQIISEEKGS